MITDSTQYRSLESALAGELARLRAQDRERTLRPVGNRRGAVVETDRGPAVDFSSNDYLGLASDPRLAAAATRAMEQHGVGAGAARLISGNTPEHDALEQELAGFLCTERALAFSTGYAANVGTISALVERGDVVFSDALNHASVIDGCRLSRAAVHVYPHADVHALEALLNQHRAAARRALIVTDGLFSMDGDIAPLDEITRLARRFEAWTYIDDAHAVGVVGEDGRGTIERLHERVDVHVGTFGKAFGAAGAFVAGTAELTQYLLNRARSFIFSTGMMPAQAAASREGVRIARDEPERRARVAANARKIRASLESRGIATIGGVGGTHIIPVLIGDDALTMRVGADLAEAGFLVGAIRPPTVPVGGSRLRITASAAHTDDHIDALTTAVARALKQ